MQLNIFISRIKPKHSEFKEQASKDPIADLALKMYLKITYNVKQIQSVLTMS